MNYIFIPSLTLIAQAVYLLEHGHRHTKAQTQLITISHALATVSVV